MKIYVRGVCGTAMGNLAVMMAEAGHLVAGSDVNIYPPMSTVLNSAGIKTFNAYNPHNIIETQPDCVIVGNIISRGNPEVEWLLNQSEIPYYSQAEFIRRFVIKNRSALVIAGTHGKTTTTAISAFLLEQLQQNPGYLIGGVPSSLKTGAFFGHEHSPFVIEGDEYDTAFFDKRSKFIHYNPQILAINNIEFDHADIFRDLTDVLKTFSHLLKIVPSKGCVIVNGDDENIQSLLPIAWVRVKTVGLNDSNHVKISNFKEYENYSTFDITCEQQKLSIHTQLTGVYNARNIAMALTSVSLLLDNDIILKSYYDKMYNSLYELMMNTYNLNDAII